MIFKKSVIDKTFHMCFRPTTPKKARKEKMTARVSVNGSEHRRPYVCRRLFADEIGPQQEGLNDNTNNEIIERLQRETREASKKWNFDFVNERPLEGNWVWERVTPSCVVDSTQRSVDGHEFPADSEERLEVSQDSPKPLCDTHVDFVEEQLKTP